MAGRGRAGIGFGLATGEGRWRDFGRLTSGLAAAFAVMLLSCAGTRADDGLSTRDFDVRWGAWGEIGGTWGTGQSSYGEIVVFAPLWQEPGGLVFTDLRGKVFESSLIEGNAALGWRRMLPSGWNIGAWGGLDVRRTAHDNVFGQVSGGLELLSEHFDARINGYLPFIGPQAVGGMADVILDGNNIFMIGGQEVALAGVDAEVGARLPFAGNGGHIGVYGGGFWFGHDDALEAVAGGKVRAELAFNDVLGAGSQVSAQYAFTHDNVRGDRHLVGARLRIPLGAPPPAASAVSGQWLRMADRIERDVDIIVGPSAAEQVINEYNQRLIQSAAVVDTGSVPDLQGAVAAGGMDSVIIVDGTYGVTSTTTLAEGQALIGGDTDLAVRGAKSGTAGIFNAGLGPGELTGAVDGGAVIALAPDSVVGGLTIANTSTADDSDGVFGDGAHGATVFGNRVSTKGETAFGIFFFGSADGTASGNKVATSGDSGFGIVFHGSDGGTASGNKVTTEGEDAYGIFFLGSADGTASGNRVKTEGDEADGIHFLFSADGTASGNKVVTEGEGADGIAFGGGTGGTVSGNWIKTGGNGADGISFAEFVNGTASGNKVATAGDDAIGISFFNFAGGIATGNKVKTEGEGAVGIFFDFSAEGGIASGNRIRTEGTNAFGIGFLDSAGGDASGNRIATQGGGAVGIFFDDSDEGTASGNRIRTEGDFTVGILFSGSDDGTATGNRIRTKGSDAFGIFFTNSADGTATGNRIKTEGSSAHGIFFDGSDGGTATGNRIRTEGRFADGIVFQDSDGGTASGNKIAIEGDDATGIDFSSAAGGTATGNKVTTLGEDAHGIGFTDSAGGTAFGNRIKTEGRFADGIVFFASAGGTASGNKVATLGEDAHGILFSSFTDGTASDNWITTAGGSAQGIRVESSSNIAVFDNRFGDIGGAVIGTGGVAAGFATDSVGNIWTGEGDGGLCLLQAITPSGSVEFDDIDGSGTPGSCPP